MPCPSHPPWLDHSNYTWRRVQVMKLKSVCLAAWIEMPYPLLSRSVFWFVVTYVVIYEADFKSFKTLGV
jgi:hypothetical protein